MVPDLEKEGPHIETKGPVDLMNLEELGLVWGKGRLYCGLEMLRVPSVLMFSSQNKRGQQRTSDYDI